MKATQVLDARRNVKKQIVSYISIMVIAMVAVSAYLGIAYPAAALRKGASDYYSRYRFWDLEVVSTMLMDEEDLETLRAIPGVKAVEGAYELSGDLLLENRIESISIIGVPDEISLPELTEGRLPAAVGECAVEEELVSRYGLGIGEHVRVGNDELVGIDPLLQKEYVITGIFRHPDHVSFQVPCTPYLLVSDDSFNREDLDGAFMKARILVDGTPENRFADAYAEAVWPVEDAVTAMADERAALRRERLVSEIEDRIREGQEQLDDAEKTLQDASAQIEQARADIKDAEQQLRDAEQDLKDAEQELQDAESEISDGKKKLDDSEGQLYAAQNQLDAAQQQLDEKMEQMAQAQAAAAAAAAEQAAAGTPAAISGSPAAADPAAMSGNPAGCPACRVPTRRRRPNSCVRQRRSWRRRARSSSACGTTGITPGKNTWTVWPRSKMPGRKLSRAGRTSNRAKRISSRASAIWPTANRSMRRARPIMRTVSSRSPMHSRSWTIWASAIGSS